MFNKTKAKVKGLFSDMFSGYSIYSSLKYKRKTSPAEMMGFYEMSLYVNRALNIRAEKVGETEFILKKGENEVETHWVLDLLAKPNKNFSGVEFFKLYQKFMDIYGEVYIKLDQESRLVGKKRVSEMFLLRSDLVKPYFDDFGQLTKIDYRTEKGTQIFLAEEIIYSHNPSPADQRRGESLLSAGAGQIDTSIQIDTYQAKVLENGGKVEGLFSFKDVLTKEQLEEQKRAYQEQHGDVSKSGLPLFLSGGSEYKNLGLSPSELSYLQTKQAILDDILMMTGVPKALMGVTSGETFSNADASIRIFLKETINPLINALVESLNERLVDEGFELTYKDPTPENQEEKRAVIDNGVKNYYLTQNEAREANGLEPLPEGDYVYAPMSISPLKEVEEPEVQEKSEEELEEKAKSRHPLRSRAKREVYHALSTKRLDRRTTNFKKTVQEYFKSQEKRIIDNITIQKHFRKKDLFDDAVIIGTEIEIARRMFLPELQEEMEKAGEDSKEISGSEWELVVTASMLAWLNSVVDTFSRQINKTTIDSLKKELVDSLGKGETREELIKRVKGRYQDIIDKRAETIARTEMHKATQYGTLEGYKQSGIRTKIWVWAPGLKGGVRENHLSIDGQEVPLNTNFSNGLAYPGDPMGSPSETVNCRCFI